MNIVFFTHPSFLNSQSMPRFAGMLSNGISDRGHKVEVLTPEARFFNLPLKGSFKKWAGYIDQYIIFPSKVRKLLKGYPADTLFVFTDQALGPWIPLVSNRPHIIHCHDLLAQRSALGQIKENPTGFTGKIYQNYIRKGYTKGNYFISVSKNTQIDLHQLLTTTPALSEVVYNGLNQSYINHGASKSRELLGRKLQLALSSGYILHVGGNQWYKNRWGVIEIYEALRSLGNVKIPLLMVGAKPSSALLDLHLKSEFRDDIHFISGLEDEFVGYAYNGASVFLFPSLAEGFGWPIAEAMANGCPVITTNEPPMSEVAGNAGFFIAKRPNTGDIFDWAREAAKMVEYVIALPLDKKFETTANCLKNAERFNADQALDEIERIYIKILKNYL